MILYYTHNAKPRGFQQRCYDFHREQAARKGQRFVSVVAEKIGDGDIVLPFDSTLPKYADIYMRILRGLEGVENKEPVYLCEDDTLYPDCRYDWLLPDDDRLVTYNLNLVYVGPLGYTRYMDGGIALSQLMGLACAVRYNIGIKLTETLNHQMACIEPCSAPGKRYLSGTCRFNAPSIDFRTGHNASWHLPQGIEYFQKLEVWPDACVLWDNIYGRD